MKHKLEYEELKQPARKLLTINKNRAKLSGLTSKRRVSKVNSKKVNLNSKKHRDYGKIQGMLQLFVLISISYSTYVVALGTDGLTPKIMLIPQALYAAYIAVQKFTK